MPQDSILKRVLKADVALFVLWSGICGLYIVDAHLTLGIGSAVNQGPVAASAVVFTLLSYRYTVKSNLRSSLNEVDTVTVQEYQIKPILHTVKWRSEIATWISNKITRTSDSERVEGL